MTYRNQNYRNDGRMSEARIAWARTVIGLFEVRQFMPEDNDDPEVWDGGELNETDKQVGPHIRLTIPTSGARKPIYLGLTSCTEPELAAIKKVIDLAFDLALPVVQQRDEVARDAEADGDDSYSRLYRQLPELAVREGKIATYREGVWHRPEDVPTRRRRGRSVDGRVRGAGGGVADEAPQDLGSEDDGQEADKS